MAKAAVKKPTSAEKSKAIVEMVLKNVELNGRLEGRKGSKVCVFPSIVGKNGEISSYVDSMIEDAKRVIEA